MDNREIGRRIRDLRKKRGMTIIDLGHAIGLSQPQISRLETGRQGLRSATLLRIAEALDVKPLYFFIGDEEKSTRDADLPYGLLAGGDLMEALRSAEFVQLCQRLAGAYLRRTDAFTAVNVAAHAILGEAPAPTRGARKAAHAESSVSR